ncbi:MAG: helix-turn-helix domain-containing protein [Clostridiales bacterium]|nr:helix-turn-helix domain-containing protein [Clostridiales bacterium]
MSIKQGEYLKSLRTSHNLSQDALSEILNISRQSISKWEQGNSFPDIENAQKLAEYYGVSIDSIVKGEADTISSGDADLNSAVNSFNNQKEDESGNTKSESGDEFPKHEKKKRSTLFYSYPVITVIIYCILGVLFSPKGWYIGWTVLLTIPLFYTAVIANEKKKPVIFCYPVLVLLIYLLLGFLFNLWHPLWILFLTIPLFYILAVKQGKKSE